MGVQTNSEIARGKKIVAHGVAQQMSDRGDPALLLVTPAITFNRPAG